MAEDSPDRGGRKNGKKPSSGAAGPALFDQPLPSNLDAEQGVLGSIIIAPEVCDEVALILRPEDFLDDAHHKLFRTILDMYELGRKIDVTLLVDQLKSSKLFEAVGGAAYLAKLARAVPHAAHAVYYANIVREKATYRSLITASTEILRDAYEEKGEAKELLASAEQRIFSILDSRGSTSVASIKDVLHEAMDRIDARMRGEQTSASVETGFKDLDQQLGGLRNSELIVLAARPSMGKTAFAMNIAENVVLLQKAPVLFVSLEMSSIELAERMLCSIARVNGHRLRNGSISNDDRRRLKEKAAEVSQAPFFVDDNPGRTVTEIAAAARRIRRREKALGLIVIDYLQLIEPDNPKDPRQEQVARITRRLKGLAREMEVPVLCLAQLNRQAEAGKEGNLPKLSHLRESGAIEQDADVVMFVHREEYYHRGDDQQQYAGQAQIVVAKQRNGPVGEVELIWKKDFTRFEDKAPERFADFDDYNASPVQYGEF
ncbi:MAG TPA: replicative DNA helicase [Pirellulaceae bacterium]|jgi:replicative DNA helicase|nr:replicative DNA helicase [Pirellulaceae bacterium]